MNKVIAPAMLIFSMVIFSSPVIAADACEVVLCLYGKTMDNSGGGECHSAEQSFFNIVKRNRHGFLPDHTADARKSFLLECSSANQAIISQIINKFGRVRGE